MIEYLPSDEIDITGNDDFKKLNEVVYQVADELVLTRQNFNNKSYIRNWILFNKFSLAASRISS